MKNGSTDSMVFTPPGAMIREQREADVIQAKAEEDPREEVLLYGQMLTDAQILNHELRRLLFSAADYRSTLRVVRGAAKRLEERAAKLLGEGEK